MLRRAGRDEVAFETEYRLAFAKQRPVKPLQLAIINLVLALGCHFVYREKVHTDAELFYSRATKLMQPFLFGTCQLALVQASLLVSLFVRPQKLLQ